MTTYRLLMGGRPVAEFRDGESGDTTPLKITGSHKVGDVTLKRGVILDSSLASWLKSANTKHHLVIQLRDEVGQVVHSWSFPNATITKAKKGHDIAIEELGISPRS